MALTSCHECDGKVSDQAKDCPHCGAPVLAKAQRIAPILPRMDDRPRCPQCRSVTIKKASLIYEGGVRTRSSHTSRTSFSRRSTTSFSTTNSVSITAKAAKCAPPSSMDASSQIFGYLFIGVIGGLFYAPIFAGFIFPSIAAYKKAKDYNHQYYYPLKDAWNHSYLCERCDHVFMLYFNEQPYVSDYKSSNYATAYTLAIIVLIVSFVYQISKADNHNNSTDTPAQTMSAPETPTADTPSVPSTEQSKENEDNISKIVKKKQISESEAQDPTPRALETPAPKPQQPEPTPQPSANTPNQPAREEINPLNDTRPIHREDNTPEAH